MREMGIRHVGIVTENPEEMIIFYESVFGFKKVWDKIENVNNLIGEDYDIRAIKLSSQNAVQIELLVLGDASVCMEREYENIGISHIAITVDNIENILDKAGTFNVFMYTKKIFVNKDGVKILFCKDTDGNILEVVEERK